jgi:hypothetical protein
MLWLLKLGLKKDQFGHMKMFCILPQKWRTINVNVI